MSSLQGTDYYAVLGVSKNATEEEIDNAFRKAEAKFKWKKESVEGFLNFRDFEFFIFNAEKGRIQYLERITLRRGSWTERRRYLPAR